MRCGIIDAGSKQNDVWGILTGTWDEWDAGEWHVVRTPFFLTFTAICDAGGHPLPFKFKVPVCGIKYFGDGGIEAIVVRPGENSINVTSKCVVKFQLFGNEAETEAVI